MHLLTRLAVVLSTVATVASFPLSAHAQEGGEDAAAAPAAPLASESDDKAEFWAKQRQVRVIQRRLYEKDGQTNITLGVGILPNDPFKTYTQGNLRIGHHITESLSLEASGSFVFLEQDSDLAGFLRDQGDYNIFSRDLQKWRGNVVLNWSPMYGKFAFAGQKLAHFDWFFGAGAGALGVETSEEGDLGVLSAKTTAEAIVTTGWDIHLAQELALRVDVRQFIFKKTGGGVALPTEIALGASYYF
jgi:outer membrane beta-barrel protein